MHLLETGEMKHFMVIVVSPLDYIRPQQVANVARAMYEVRAAAIGESDANDKEISEGKHYIIYDMNKGLARDGKNAFSMVVCIVQKY